MSKKINYISIFKFIAITLVIIGHIPITPNYIKNFIYAFHMPLFFIIYGYIKSDHTKYNNKRIGENIENKFSSIIVPYIIWGFIYAGISVSSIKGIIYGSHITLKEVSNSSLWFLPTYFISVLLFDLYQKMISKKEKIYLIDFILIILSTFIGIMIPIPSKGVILGLNTAIIGLSLMIIGKYIKKINIDNINNIRLTILFIVSSLLIMLYKFNSVSYMLFSELKIGNIFLFYIISILGFISILSLSILLDKTALKKYNKYILYIGNNTLVVFALQKLLIGPLTKVLNKITLIPIIPSIIVVTIITLIISYFGIKVVNRYIPELNGKKIKLQ